MEMFTFPIPWPPAPLGYAQQDFVHFYAEETKKSKYQCRLSAGSEHYSRSELQLIGNIAVKLKSVGRTNL